MTLASGVSAVENVLRAIARRAPDVPTLIADIFMKLYRPRSLVVHIASEQVTLARPFESSVGRQLYVGRPAAIEWETVPVFLELVEAAKTFFDVGAHVGIYTLLAKSHNRKLRTVSFEAQPQLCRLLAESLTLNGFENAGVENLALDEVDGEGTLYLANRDAEASMSAEFFSSRSRTLVAAVRCRTLKLDTYCADRDLTSVDLIKIDTETTEPRVLRGGRTMIAQSKPDIICEVLHGRTERELEDFLQPLGYRYYHITADGLRSRSEIRGDPDHRCLNYLFSPRGDLG